MEIIFNSYESIKFSDFLIYKLQSRIFTSYESRNYFPVEKFSDFHWNFRNLFTIRFITYIFGFVNGKTHLNVAINRNITHNWRKANNSHIQSIIKKIEISDEFNTVIWDDFNMLHKTPKLTNAHFPRFFFSGVYFHKERKPIIQHKGTSDISNIEQQSILSQLSVNHEYGIKYHGNPNEHIKTLDTLKSNIQSFINPPKPIIYNNNNLYDGGSIIKKINNFNLKTLQKYAKINNIKYKNLSKEKLIQKILKSKI